MNSRGALLVVVLLCLSQAVGARGESGSSWVSERESHVVEPAGTLPQLSFSELVWNELRELRDMVVGQRETLRNMEAKVAASEEEAKEQRNLATDLRVELTIAKRAIEAMAKDNTVSAHHAQLSTASDNQLQDLLPFSNIFMKDTQTKGAFYAGLLSNALVVGPFDSDTTVVYGRVLTDVHSGYNPNTGVFTPRYSGVYYIRFTAAFSVTLSGDQCIRMVRSRGTNTQSLTYNCGYSNPGQVEYVSAGAIVRMYGSEEIFVRLPAGWKLHDSVSGHNMFSAVLIYGGR